MRCAGSVLFGRPWRRGKRTIWSFALFFPEVAVAASKSASREGPACRRDPWPTRWPFFHLLCGGHPSPVPDLDSPQLPSGSSPATLDWPVAAVPRRKRVREHLPRGCVKAWRSPAIDGRVAQGLDCLLFFCSKGLFVRMEVLSSNSWFTRASDEKYLCVSLYLPSCMI